MTRVWQITIFDLAMMCVWWIHFFAFDWMTLFKMQPYKYGGAIKTTKMCQAIDWQQFPRKILWVLTATKLNFFFFFIYGYLFRFILISVYIICIYIQIYNFHNLHTVLKAWKKETFVVFWKQLYLDQMFISWCY